MLFYAIKPNAKDLDNLIWWFDSDRNGNVLAEEIIALVDKKTNEE